MKIKKLLTISLMLLTISGATFASVEEKNEYEDVPRYTYLNYPINKINDIIPKNNPLFIKKRKAASKIIVEIITNQPKSIKKTSYGPLNIKNFIEKNTEFFELKGYSYIGYRTINLLDIIDESKIDFSKIERFKKLPHNEYSYLNFGTLNLKENNGEIRGSLRSRKVFFKAINFEKEYQELITKHNLEIIESEIIEGSLDLSAPEPAKKNE